MASSKHCHKCGWIWPLSALPGRNECCHQCSSDMKVCLNCSSYDARASYQCRDRRAEFVQEKHQANFCEFFDFARRDWTAAKADTRESKARDDAKKLLGD